MFREIGAESTAVKKEEFYPYNVFRFPSLGMLACPPDVPAEVFGLQMAFSMANNLPFLNWGLPDRKFRAAIIDMTNSDYNLIRIRQSLSSYFKRIGEEMAGGNVEMNLEMPRLYALDLVISKGRIEGQSAQDFLDYLKQIVDEGFNFIYLHGLSGFFDDAFYDCVSRMKRITIEQNTCMIVNHVIASVVYSQNNESALRGPLSHSMIRESHQEASAIMDWTWFVAPTTVPMIKTISGSDLKQVPQGASLYANKIIHPNRFLGLGNAERAAQCPAKGLFYLYKSTSPILFNVELLGAK